ncbi:hypothetical protein L1049_013319 [Liquidambar formosana]|uniref:Uncharacterized protein n=1 Tax=Liquidambar formosana TaxID=63359 RepID=A0AAP0WY74_LIQFO
MALQSRLRAALEGRTHNSDPSINWSIQHEVPQISLGTSIIMMHRMQVPPVQNITTRVRYWRSNPSEEGLPLYYNVYDIKMQRHQPLTSVSLGKTFMGLIFQAAVGLMAFSFQSSSPSSSSQAKDIQPSSFRLHVIEVVMMIGFTGLLIGILLRHAYPSMARVMEMMGYIFSIIEFFVMNYLDAKWLSPPNYS